MTRKRILFINISFYDYNQSIEAKMRELGYEVDSFCEDPKSDFCAKLINKLNSNYLIEKSWQMQDELINKIKSQNIKYDVILVIKGEKLKSNFLRDLKHINPTAKLILYLWDDVARVSNFSENKRFYDKIYSFDRIDAAQYGFSFLPLFFCDEFRNDGNYEKTFDIYFSGWEHSNRRKFIEKVLSILHSNNMKVYFHLFTSRWKTFKEKLSHLNMKKEPEYIKYTTLSLQQNADLTKSSKVLIDIPHPTQNGLTMRTIEALGARAKLITTNRDIVKYDFYNPNNILIVDFENPVIDTSFLISPYKSIPDEVVEKYSLANWLLSLLG